VSRQPRASGYYRTGYGQDLALIGTRLEAGSLAALVLALLVFPFLASPFQLDLACQVFLACVGALSLMLLTGYAGQISLGHAGLMAAGAFTVGILFREANAPFWITLPAAALVGGVSASVVKHGGNLGTIVVALVGAAVAAGIVVVSRRNPVHAHNVNEGHEVTIRTAPPASVGTAA